MDSAPLTDDVVPAWRDVPRLGRVCALGVLPLPLADRPRLFWLVCAPLMLVTVPGLVGARLCGQLAGSRHSLVIISRSARRNCVYAFLLLICLMVEMTPVVVVAVAVELILGWQHLYGILLATYGGYFVLLLLAALPGLSRQPLRLARPPKGVTGCGFWLAVSWPRGEGHGRSLWVRMVPVLAQSGGPVVARAAHVDLAKAYAALTEPPGVVDGTLVTWQTGMQYRAARSRG